MSPRLHVFPVATSAGATPFDPARLEAGITTLLEGLCGVGVELVAASPGDAALSWWRRDDGLACGIGGAALLATALVSRDCGGTFDADARLTAAASVVRTQARLGARLRAVLARLWPGEGEWTAAEPVAAVTHGWLIDAGGVVDHLDIAVVPPPVVSDDSLWRGALHERLSRLDVDVRLVLHDAPIAVRAAQRLAAGDTVPIATASEVGLRVGHLALATARVVGSDGDRPSIEIIARPRAFREQHA